MDIPTDSCSLCGLPLPSVPVVFAPPRRLFRFCCIGCRQVFQLLLEASPSADPASFKESDLFRKCQEAGIIPRSEKEAAGRDQALPENVSGKLSGPVAVARQAEPRPAPLSLTLKVGNMWCPACAWVIAAYLNRAPGVVSAECNFSTDYLRCDYNPIATTPDQIAGAVRSLGYRPLPCGGKDPAGNRAEFIRFGVCAVLTANVMMLSFALYSGFFRELSGEAVRILSWPIFVMAAGVVSYGGYPIYRKALAGLFSAAFGMETLIGIASASAFLFSIINLSGGNIHLYFDTASMLITLVLLGKLLEWNAKRNVQADLESFFSLRPAKARICSQPFPEGRYADTSRLQVGDCFLAAEKETIAADGLVLSGNGLLDVAALTGEPCPVKAQAGDRVRCGSTVISGRLRVKAEAVGDESTIGQMIQVMEKALGRKTPIEGKTDRLLHFFVPAILLLAGLTGAVCLYGGLAPGEALIRVITVLVIACPCSLGIAIPLARVAGISLAGRSGLLIRNFAGVEAADRISAVVFDKTGTLTRGRWDLIDATAFGSFTVEQVLSWAAALEKNSDHSIGAAIRRYAAAHRIASADMDRISRHENGVVGYHGGSEVKIGSAVFLGAEPAPAGRLNGTNILPEQAVRSRVYMSFAGHICAALTFGDSIKPGAAEAVGRLKTRGLRICVVSGDGAETTAAVAGRLGVDEVFGGLLPRQKAAVVEALQKAGKRVAMVGDGLNDAPALVQADLSLAVHSGSHLGAEVADVTLMRGDPLQLIHFLDLARHINTKIFQNLLMSFLYNLISIPVAMSGLLNPLIAVSAMLLSSLTVIANTLLLLKKKGLPAAAEAVQPLDS